MATRNPIPTGRPLSAREFLALPTSGIPFIPELHADDCDDVDCVRCVPAPTIARLDIPAEQVSAEEILRETGTRHTAAGDWDEDEIVAAAEAIRLVTHPDSPLSTEADYPQWAAALAARNTKAGGQA